MEEDFARHGYQFLYVIKDTGAVSSYKVQSTKYSCCFVIKRYDLNHININEITNIAMINCPMAATILDKWQDDNNLYTVVSFFENGSIEDYIRNNSCVPGDKIKMWTRQIVEGLVFCHNYGIAHNNLKPSNILINEYNHVILTDFGFTSNSKKTEYSPYFAPECNKNGQYNLFLADVWSLGAIVQTMITGRPFVNCQIDYPRWLDNSIKELVESTTIENPCKRPNSQDILNKLDSQITRSIKPSSLHSLRGKKTPAMLFPCHSAIAKSPCSLPRLLRLH